VSVSCNDFFELLLLLKLLNDEVNHYFGKYSLRLGLSLSELQILWIVSLSNETTFLEIARLTGQSKNEIREVVTALEADGLVQQIHHSDSPRCTIAATHEGRSLIGELPSVVDRMCARMKDSQEVQDLLHTSRQVVEVLKGADYLRLIGNRVEQMKQVSF
jgi:DNA-binding MarR family transcriptional regulator